MGYSVADIWCWCFNGVDGYRSQVETMIQPVILEKLAELPEPLQTEVLYYEVVSRSGVLALVNL
ncbi:hypothetical protein [Microcoleus sp. D3_18_C4]|uniref:hypothetical protein n=1 Tax=Microcoleus sp. D3_18_C4 TaxID=3055335 RepID=UPI002FCEF8D8